MIEPDFLHRVKNNIIAQVMENKIVSILAVLIFIYLAYCLLTNEVPPKEEAKTIGALGVIIFFGILRPIIIALSTPRWKLWIDRKLHERDYPSQTKKSGKELVEELYLAEFYDTAVDGYRDYVMDKQRSFFNETEEIFAIDHPENEYGDFVSMDRKLWFFDAKVINYKNGIRDFLIEARDVFIANGFEMNMMNAIDEQGTEHHHRTTELTINNRHYSIFSDRAICRFESGFRVIEVINNEAILQGLKVRCYVHRENIVLATEQQADVIRSAYINPEFGLADEHIFKEQMGCLDLPALEVTNI